MPSDRDRLTFDPKQRYRGVVAQQGRVTVAADFNEAQEISSEHLREETLDIIGPVGTPDDGYKIQLPAPPVPGDFLIGAGTMYVGGLCAFLPSAIKYSAQTDWLDAPPGNLTGNEYVFLQLEDREISAVEDSALREVALGGPDTTQRTRLLQRIVRSSTTGTNCDAALKGQNTKWQAEGWVHQPSSARLQSVARLQAGFQSSGPLPGPCDPPATGGYLGAENQMIRVQVSAPGKFVWGFDNASFLYRVDVVDNQTIKLQTPPPDTFHFPKAGQAIELLRAEAQLSNGEYVAAGKGLVMVLAEAYNPDTQTIRLPAALTASFIPPGGTPRLFVRVWEREEDFVSGTAVALASTGVTVTLTFPAGTHTGDFWSFSVRPSTPVEIYPKRYAQSPQPPEGPRLWVCPLAVIQWTPGNAGSIGTVLSDCREPFDNLVELTKRKGNGCCTIVLRPSSLQTRGLTDIIKALPVDQPVKVCLEPGIYELKAPVVIDRNNVTIEACPGGAILRSERNPNFRHGMIILNGASGITLRGLEFRPLEAPVAGRPLLGLSPGQMAQLLDGPSLDRVAVSGAIRILSCQDITIEECRFAFPAKPEIPSLFAYGVYVSGPLSGLRLVNNDFTRLGEGAAAVEISAEEFRVWAGYLQSQVTTAQPGTTPTAVTLQGTVAPTLLQDAVISGNRFQLMTVPVFALGETGRVMVEGNVATQCHSGFWILTPHTIGFAERALDRDHKEVGAQFDWRRLLADPVVQIVAGLARAMEAPFALPNPHSFNSVVVKPTPFPGIPATKIGVAFFRLWANLGEIETRAIAEAVTTFADFSVCENDVNLAAPTLTGAIAFTGPALVLWADDIDREQTRTANTSAIVSANKLSGQAQPGVPLAIVILFRVSTATGSIVSNESKVDSTFALMVFPVIVSANSPAQVAITGNFCRGDLRAPNRLLPPPLNTWHSLNTVLPV